MLSNNSPSQPLLATVTWPSTVFIRTSEMKFEPDLIRDILIYVEENAQRARDELEEFPIDGWNREQIAYHVKLAMQDDLVEGRLEEIPDDEDDSAIWLSYTAYGLTMNGHRFLSAVREPARWKLVKAGANKVGSIAVSTMVSVAEALIKKQLADLTGFQFS